MFCLVFTVIVFLHGNCQDSVVVAVKPVYDSVSNTHRFFLGDNYRRLWATPVKLRVLKLANEKGGLTIVKQGGGLQTRSLRLVDKKGKEWVLRTLEKYPERKLPDNLKASVVKDILQDQVTTANPFAALTVPPLAGALGIPHANPQIVYVADDTALGVYRAAYANKVFLFEERDVEEDINSDNTAKVQKELREDNDVGIDQQIVLRARLLDILLGDWDRHEDQWRWAKNKEKKSVTYIPIPRDRDQVYYRTSGVLPWIVSHQFLMSKFQGFNETIRDINGWNLNARNFDRFFLTAMDEKEWKREITYLQQVLTDSLFKLALQRMPPPIYNASGNDLLHKLIIRRDNLEKYALQYYRFICTNVDLPFSEKHESFEINYGDSGQVGIKVYKIKKTGEKDKLIYQRMFDAAVTKEVRLYGIGGNDVFSVHGSGHSPIKIRMIGGTGRDSFYIATGSKGRLFLYDRKDKPNAIPEGKGIRLRLSRDTMINVYEAVNFTYDRTGPMFSADYNNDDNIILKLGFLMERQGFRKQPYASRQTLWVNYSTGRHFLRMIYDADFKKAIANNDIQVNIISRGPHYIRNFFGIGNETVFENTGGKKISYYRTRHDFVTGEVRLRHPLGKYLSANAGLRGQYYTAAADNNQGNSLDLFSTANPDKNIFSHKTYGGLVAGMQYDSRNDLTLPAGGVYSFINLMGMRQLNQGNITYAQLNGEFNHYLALNKDSTLVLANRLGGGIISGNPDFFQMLYLGGNHNLRGFRNYRFAGKSYAYHNIELRAKLFDFTSYILPGTVGLTLFNDLGRVWAPGESSSKWHDGYGGGIYIQPAQLVLIQVQAGHSVEGWLPYISLGFRF